LSTQVGLPVASRFVMPMTTMSFATTAAGTTSVKPVVRLPEVATHVPLVIAKHHAYAIVNHEVVMSTTNVSPLAGVMLEV
jgi:hypothetical protein